MLLVISHWCILEHQHYYNFVIVTFCLIIAGDAANVIGYGHLGDGNLHLNVSVPQYDEKVAQTN
jgi:D-2-hydroxyglutarate dehydrogenase